MIHKADYIDYCEPFHMFKEYGNTDITFFKTWYYIDAKYYKSKTSNGDFPALPKVLLASNGQNIFRQQPITKQIQYYLLDDTQTRLIPDGDGLMEVIETWGFVPDVRLKRGGTVPWTRPGWIANPTGTRQNITAIPSWDTANGTQTITVADVSSFKVGDIIVLKKNDYGPIPSWGAYVLGGYSTPIAIWAINTGAKTITIPSDFTFTKTLRGVPQSSVSGTDSSFNNSWYSSYLYSGTQGWVQFPQARYVDPSASTRKAESGDFPCIYQTEFFYYNDIIDNTLPDRLEVFKITKAGEITDTLEETTTTPTVGEYRAKIATKDVLIPQDAVPRKIMGFLWARDVPLLTYQ